MLFDMLRTNNSSIKDIRLSGNQQINDECMKSVGEYIKYNKSIEVISLNSNKISDAGIEILAPYLDGNTTFKELSFNWNKGITDKSIPYFVNMIESSHIVDMDISGASITQKNIIDVCVPLTINRIKYDSTEVDLFLK